MFKKDLIAIEIDGSNIRILVGNKSKVTAFGIIKTPEESFRDDRIINIDLIAAEIEGFLRNNNIKVKNVGFSVRGKDIIIRHKDVPAIDVKSIKENVEWEFRQSLPQNGVNHYVDCEIVEKDKTTAKVLIAAVSKGKIDNYVQLAEKLNLNIKVIDVASNCTARVFKSLTSGKKPVNSAGIIELGNNSTGFTILEKGNLFMNREMAFGLTNLYNEISKSSEEIAATEKPYDYLINHVNLNDLMHRNRFDDNGYEGRIMNLFDNVFNSFMRALEFYTAGKTNKELEMVFVVGEGCAIPGLSGYIKNYFNTQIAVVNSAKKLNLNVKLPAGCELKDYINALGLLMRKES